MTQNKLSYRKRRKDGCISVDLNGDLIGQLKRGVDPSTHCWCYTWDFYAECPEYLKVRFIPADLKTTKRYLKYWVNLPRDKKDMNETNT